MSKSPQEKSDQQRTPKFFQGKDQQKQILEELGIIYHKMGNPLALHEVIKRAQSYQLPLPVWAAEALMKQEIDHLNDPKRGKLGRYRQKLKPYLRHKTYHSIMAWLKDARFYRSMPRSVIQRWFDGDLSHASSFGKPKFRERALEIAQVALAPTFAECKIATLEKALEKDPLAEIPEDRRDFLRSLIVLEEWEGMDKVLLLGGFFGPPGPPPESIELELKEAEAKAKK